MNKKRHLPGSQHMTTRSILASIVALAAMGTGIAATAQDLPAPVQARQG
jgi:hypothetical protein